MPAEMRHLIILLPGFMGSVLQKEGKDLWALSGQALWPAIKSMGKSLGALKIEKEDWQQDNLGDGIVATRVIQDLHSVPFLIEHNGYSTILQRIPGDFKMTVGSIDQPQDEASFFPFPWDWRRDCRVAARKLQRFIDQQLPRWRKWSGAKDAQVILIGHSMGGLVARYYLEVLGGWRNTRAVITVGSPHRGVLGPLELISNGFKGGLFPELVTAARSFEAVYQAFPTYPAIEVNGQYQRLGETSGIPNIDQARAKAAREDFLEAIRQAAVKNRQDSAYRQSTIPWVGTRQDTPQSALFSGGKLTVRNSAPAGIDPLLAGGDSAVPRISAVPADLEGDAMPIGRFVVERHGWLTNNSMALDPLVETLRDVAATGTRELYGTREVAQTTSVNLNLESLYLPGESVTATINLINANDQPYDLTIEAAPVRQDGTGAKREVKTQGVESQTVEFGELTPGLYYLNVRGVTPTPIKAQGIFEVVAAEAMG
jgi:pimeloyl-ACP methyl ester carboxylesterase